MALAPKTDHNTFQRDYYETNNRKRVAVVDTPYVRAHVDRMIEVAELSPKHRVLEIGAGPGKFTLQLAARGYDIVANDLSQQLLVQLASAAQQHVPTIACDVLNIDQFADQKFDRIVGFFVLHHLVDFPRVFGALAKVVKPGGVIAFCEPVAFNPLYYLQILLTPNMTFAGERSLTAMRRSVIAPALADAGFVEAEKIAYGYFPPEIKNKPWGDRLEQWLERRRFVPFPRAFQIFSAKKAE